MIDELVVKQAIKNAVSYGHSCREDCLNHDDNLICAGCLLKDLGLEDDSFVVKYLASHKRKSGKKQDDKKVKEKEKMNLENISIKDIRTIKTDTKNSICVIAYKCTNCHEISESKEDAESCCD